MWVISQFGRDTNIFKTNSTHAVQLIFSRLAIRQLSLYAFFNNAESVVNNLCKKLHVFDITLIHKGYLPNPLKMAIFVDFLFIFDMYFKKLYTEFITQKVFK